jgi:hypothetical protein
MLNARRDHHDENPTNRSEHQGDHLGATRAFYGEILGLEVAMDLGFIETFISPNDPTVQISFIREDPSGLDPQLTWKSPTSTSSILVPRRTEPISCIR